VPVADADPFLVELERFHGPLDLLLHLIRKQDIDIFDIPISRITEQFLHAVERLRTVDLERAGTFLEMAATLVRIKAQLLFPRRETDDEEDPRADLVRRLLEYEHFREAAKHLASAERMRARHRGRGYVEPRRIPAASEHPLETTWAEIEEAITRLAERLGAEDDAGYRFASRPVRIEEKIDFVLGALERQRRVRFEDLVSPWGTRMHAVVSLLACLELARRHMVRLRQEQPFAVLWVQRPSQRIAS